MFLDLYKQIAGNMPLRTHIAKKADNGMMLNIGGSATTNYVFIIGRE
jgi:acetyl-CoA C-acetyltransferase